MTISKPLDAFAKELIEEARRSDSIETKLEAFKLLTAYHIGVTKARKGEPEHTDEDTFAALKNGIMAADRELEADEG